MYAELQCKSHYSFLDSASSPEELVLQAAALGYQAIAITDECSYSGLVKAYQASKAHNIKLIVGTQLSVSHQSNFLKLVLLAKNLVGYQEISALISTARRRSPKGEYSLNSIDLRFGLKNCLAIFIPSFDRQDETQLTTLDRYFKERLWLGVGLNMVNDQRRYWYVMGLAERFKLNMVACNDVRMHTKRRKPLLDTVTAIRLNSTVQILGKKLSPNAEKYLKPIPELTKQYPIELLLETLNVASLCNVDMGDLKYQYPKELIPADETPSGYLERLCAEGFSERWPVAPPSKMRQQLNKELKVIRELGYEYYFLTVYDIVKFARSQGILCQGRGSAANSVVCYCLFITEVDPTVCRLLFERFISKERDEPPDIDVDFESQRREEVIQYIYQKYGRKRTALAATVITYRRKSAVRDVAKALGLSESFANELNKSMAWWDKIEILQAKFHEHKLDYSLELVTHFFKLVTDILGTPRHLSQHVGGFIITETKTSNLVPIENASMPDRTVIQWDKYDIEILGLLKVDVLGLGMLSAIQKSFKMINEYQPAKTNLDTMPKEDPAVYDMLCKGDSIGVFQVESRAQMSMLPRLKPRQFYDLVIEVAIVRPGPIQGDMVHPYLKRRNGEEPVEYATDEIREVLKRTLGVPIFQEQVIELTMVAAGFTGGEADQLRRTMASWGQRGSIEQFEAKLVNGMLANGHDESFARRLFSQIQGFGSYGFPESHSASFALLVYASAWLKRHHPAAFYVGILNSQPMGFYSPSQLIQDATRHEVTVLPVCINNSDWNHRVNLEYAKPAIRLGLRLIKGVSEDSAIAIEDSRRSNTFESITDFKHRKLINKDEFMKLVSANAFADFDSNRRSAYWQSLKIDDGFNHSKRDDSVPANIKPLSPMETLLSDYQHANGVSLNYHPMQLLRNVQPFSSCCTAKDLLRRRNNSLINVSGVVTGKQRPGTASGVLFMTLEDETGNINVVVWSKTQERFKKVMLTSKILYVKGTLEHKHGVAHVVAGYLEDRTSEFPKLATKTRSFH